MELMGQAVLCGHRCNCVGSFGNMLGNLVETIKTLSSYPKNIEKALPIQVLENSGLLAKSCEGGLFPAETVPRDRKVSHLHLCLRFGFRLCFRLGRCLRLTRRARQPSRQLGVLPIGGVVAVKTRVS